MSRARPLSPLAWQLRGLWRSKKYSAFVVLCLGLGLASTAVVSSTVDAYLLRPLPFHDPDRLLSIWKLFHTDQGRDQRYFLAPPDFDLVRREARGFRVAAHQPGDLDVLGGSEPERLAGARVSGDLFSLLGARPLAGRLIEPADESSEAAVAVVEGGFAVRRFGSASAAIGEVLRVDGRAHEIVGVLPPGSVLPSGAEIWIPLTRREHEGRLGFAVTARVEAGRTPREAVDEARRLGARLVEVDAVRNGSAGLGADTLQRSLVGDLRPMLLALFLAVLLLLGIACANTTFLVLARARRRSAERSLREILGAGRLRLLLEALVENGTLAVLAATGAIGLAAVALPLVPAISPVESFTFMPIRIDLRVVAIVFALAGAMAGALSLAALLGGGGGVGSVRDGRRVIGTPRVLATLLVLDVFLTTILLVGTGVMARTVERLAGVAPGLEASGVTTVGVSASAAWSGDHTKRVAFFEKILEEVAALPGVVAAAAVNTIPMAASEFYWGISVEERPPADPGATEPVLFRVVTPGYFETLQIPLLAGRSFSRLDGPDSPRAVVCNRAFAERHFPGRDALGKRIKGGRYDAAGDWVEIVGVVADVRERGLAQPVDPALYLPMPQWDRAYLSRMHLLVRSDPGAASPVRALRERVRAVDADAVLFDVEPMTTIVARTLSRHRFALTLIAAFALFATVQATAGIYGMMAFDTGNRRREIGVRLALGAAPAAVRRWVIRSSLVRGALGLAPGLAASFGMLWWGRSRWRGVEVGDASIYLGVAALVAAAVIAATFFPARRAAAIDPARALQAE